MPFTPFHMGPGLAIKAVTGRHFSLLAFGVAQVAMDIEPLVGMLTSANVLHGASHTYLAAVPIAAASGLATPLLCRPALRRWNRELAAYDKAWLIESDDFRWLALATGALTGTLTHVALDSIMHHDIHPLAPFSGSNALLAAVPLGTLHAACVVAGFAGALLWLAARWFRR